MTYEEQFEALEQIDTCQPDGECRPAYHAECILSPGIFPDLEGLEGEALFYEARNELVSYLIDDFHDADHRPQIIAAIGHDAYDEVMAIPAVTESKTPRDLTDWVQQEAEAHNAGVRRQLEGL